uniref:Chemotaxis protein n=1 Tax=Paraburkholderia sprentiae WSM5005 TaxID=754502 RepID=A0A1I9YWG7_9BURK
MLCTRRGTSTDELGDQVTQRNAALVERASAAASSLKDRTGRLAKLVGQFKLEGIQAEQPARDASDEMT